MGTYDTRGGSPVSPDVPDPYISELQEAVLGVLEAAGVPTHVNDEVVRLICAAEADPWIPGAREAALNAGRA